MLNLVDQLLPHSGSGLHPPHLAQDTNGADIERIPDLVRVRLRQPRHVM
jgi:hypothetical protein